MPEGDTVYRLAARLGAALSGRVVTRSDLRVASVATRSLTGRRILGLETHGKHLLTHFDDDQALHTHLRMTGSWTVTRPGRSVPRRVLPDVRVILGVDSGATAWGISLPVVELLDAGGVRALHARLGPDPLRPDWDPQLAVQLLSSEPDRPVSAALLDQRVIAGLGNLWANELCFLRGLHPDRPVGTVDVPALVALAAKLLRISAGRTVGMQVTTGNLRRGEQHWVAGRAHRPCLRCGTPVRVVDEQRSTSGRRTWFCPTCQPPPSA